MDTDKAIQNLIEKYDLRKRVWKREDKNALEEEKETVLKKVIFILIFFIGVGTLSLYGAYCYREQAVFLSSVAFVFLFIGFVLLFRFFRLFRKMKEREKNMRRKSSAYALYEFRKYPTVNYMSMTELDNISDEDTGKIASCIKDSITETGEHYTFNIAFLDDADIKLIISPDIFTKIWYLHDGHSPFFVDISISEVSGYSKKILSIQIAIKKEEYEGLKEEIEQIKDKACDCALKVINEIES